MKFMMPWTSVGAKHTMMGLRMGRTVTTDTQSGDWLAMVITTAQNAWKRRCGRSTENANCELDIATIVVREWMVTVMRAIDADALDKKIERLQKDWGKNVPWEEFQHTFRVLQKVRRLILQAEEVKVD